MTVALRDITERKRIEMEQLVLAEAGPVLASSLDYRQTLETIGELVTRHAAQICVIDMIEEGAIVRSLTVAHADPTKAAACRALAKLSLDPRHTLAALALETRQPQLFDDISPEFLATNAQDEEHLRLLREIDPRSALVVPLLSGDRVLGALVLASSRPHQFGARDIGLATELARRAALAIENARLYEAEKRATRARDEVLGIVAHDVRSPLHVILLAAQMLERRLAKVGDATCQEYVGPSCGRSLARSASSETCSMSVGWKLGPSRSRALSWRPNGSSMVWARCVSSRPRHRSSCGSRSTRSFQRSGPIRIGYCRCSRT
jgi:GAF domain-containing protein